MYMSLRPRGTWSRVLTDSQKRLIGHASHLCVSVGPPQVTEDILSARAPNSRLYWAMKDDAQSFTPEICAALSASTDVIFCNRAERGMVTATSAIVIETRGAEGVSVTIDGTETLLTVSPAKCRDMTGSGDSFAGGFITADVWRDARRGGKGGDCSGEPPPHSKRKDQLYDKARLVSGA